MHLYSFWADEINTIAPFLLQIGLSNLLHIERGGVKIDKCPQICYVETINWSMIGTGLDYHDIAHLTCPCSPKCKGI